MAVQPSRDGALEYRPCLVTLADGSQVDRVYVVPFEPYLRVWGVEPEQDPGKKALRIQDVVRIEESPSRLPPAIANKLYRAGETGMGYFVFTIAFRDGHRQKYVTGNAVDFLPFTDGRTSTDVADVVVDGGPWQDAMEGPDYYWCLYDGLQRAS